MISKPTYLTNAKLEEMYGGAMFWFYTTIQRIPSARIWCKQFCYWISRLTQVTSPERFDQMKYVEQREESLQQIVSIPREESLQQIVLDNCCHNAILQNQNKIHASTVKIWFNGEGMLWVYMISVIAKDKDFSAASISCQQSFQQIQLCQAMKSGTLGTKNLRQYRDLCNSTC